jgi:general secretion pathway protein I
MISSPYRGSRRRGLTLLEVLIALGIFLMSLVAISTMITLSADRALDVQHLGQATQLCQAKLAEVAAGIVPLSGQTGVPFDEDPNFLWSLDAEQADIAGLWKVTVRVSLQRSDGSRIESSLDRMLLDPSLRGSTLDAAVIAAANSSSSSTSSNSNSSSSTSGSTTSSTPSSSGGAATPAASSSTQRATTGSSSGASAPKATTGSTPSSSGSKGSSSTPKGGS